MRTRWHMASGAGVVALLTLLASTSAVGRPAAGATPDDAIVVVVNEAGPLAAAGDAEIRDAFLGKIRVVAGVPVQPVQLKGEVATTFLRTIVGMSEREFQLHWMRKAYEDGRLPPPTLVSADEVLRFVAGRPGAIGFVERRDVGAAGTRIIREIAAPAGDP